MEELLTYDELADRLGINRNAARVLVQRRRWRRSPGNDGRTRVHVPGEELEEQEAARRAPGHAPEYALHEPPHVGRHDESREGARAAHVRAHAPRAEADGGIAGIVGPVVEALREQLEAQRDDHQAERERLEAEIVRLQDEAERERAEARAAAERADRLLDEERSALAALLEQVRSLTDRLAALQTEAAAEREGDRERHAAELAALQAEIDALRRPWWRRMLRR
jgi:hypothetical protein